jgi:hypothetical protein
MPDIDRAAHCATSRRPEIVEPQDQFDDIQFHYSPQHNRQPDLFGPFLYPEIAGSKERSLNSASRKQAERVPNKALQRVVHTEMLRHGDGTADEVAARLAMDILTIRPRLSELRQLGMIVATEARRPSSRGTPSTVWHAIAERGAR